MARQIGHFDVNRQRPFLHLKLAPGDECLGLVRAKHAVGRADGADRGSAERGSIDKRPGHVPATDDSGDHAGGEGVAAAGRIDDRHVVGAATPALAAARGDSASRSAGDDRGPRAGRGQRRDLVDRVALAGEHPRLVVVRQEVVDHRQELREVAMLGRTAWARPRSRR